MFKFDIAKDFKVGVYTYNTTVPAVRVSDVTSDNVTISGYKALFYQDEVHLVNGNPCVPAVFEDYINQLGYNREHNWKTRNGHYEAYYEIQGNEEDERNGLYLRYVWSWSSKQATVELAGKIENCFLPLSQPRTIDADIYKDIVKNLRVEPELSFDNVLPHINAILEDIVAVGKTPSFQSEIQRMLLESSSTMVAIARTISHAYMPLTYKQIASKIYVHSAFSHQA